jgi:hypothetical protein
VGASAVYQLPYPEPGDPADVPTDLHELADRLEAVFVPGTLAGQLPQWDNATKRWVPGGLPLTVIADVALSAIAASFDFQNIPQTFRHLLLIGSARMDVAAVAGQPTIRFNADAGNNYDYWGAGASNSAVAILGSTGVSSAFLTPIPGASATAGRFGPFVMVLDDYTNPAKAKQGIIVGGRHYGGSATYVAMEGIGWSSVAPINRITIGGTGNFIIASRATLYGLP